MWATSAGGATPPWTTSGCRASSRGWASTQSWPPRRSASSRTVSLSCLPTPKVPAIDGVLIFRFLQYCQVHKDRKAPMLMSGCKAADSYGFMLFRHKFLLAAGASSWPRRRW